MTETKTPSRTPSLLIPLVILLVLLLIAGYLSANPTEGQRVLAELGLAEPPQEGYVLSGLLEAEMTRLGSPLGGRVQSVAVGEGQHVDAGALLAELDRDALALQERIAQSAVHQAALRLQMLQRGPRETDLAVAHATVQQARVAVEAAEQGVRDAQQSADQPGGDTRLAQARAQAAQARAALQIALAQVHALTQGASQADLQAAQAAPHAAQAALDRVQAHMATQRLTAPSEAVVSAVLLHPGELAMPGQPVVALRSLDHPLYVTVYVPEADLGRVQVGTTVTVRADAFPDTAFYGEVVHIADRAEFTPRNVQTPEDHTILVYAARVEVNGPPDMVKLLKPGLPVDVIFEVQP